jgi:ammonia channel protein AmtB
VLLTLAVVTSKRQLVGALFIIGWNIVWTSLILLFIKHALRIPLRMTDEELEVGDDAIHGVSHYSSLVATRSATSDSHFCLMQTGRGLCLRLYR